MTDKGRTTGRSFRFSKKERLTGKKEIEELFKNGSSFYLRPLLVKYQPEAGPASHHRVLFTVSKKNFKRAVDRNLLKRRMREAYRLNKDVLNSGIFYKIAFVYVDKRVLPYTQIEPKLKILLHRLENQAAQKGEAQ